MWALQDFISISKAHDRRGYCHHIPHDSFDRSLKLAMSMNWPVLIYASRNVPKRVLSAYNTAGHRPATFTANVSGDQATVDVGDATLNGGT